jgi:hypothetical protein
LGTVKLLPMPAHLVLDAAKSAFLASSPWLSGLPAKATRYRLPHALLVGNLGCARRSGKSDRILEE